jgi:hypothetical protein
MTFSFADPGLLLLDSVQTGSWPCDSNDRALVFHPLTIYQVLPPAVLQLSNKQLLITSFIEFAKSSHYLWIHKHEEIADLFNILHEYIKLIYFNYGQDSMDWAIESACRLGPSCERLIDLAANGIGSW